MGGAGEEGQIPLTVVFCCESEQGECKVSQEAVDIELQEYPRRLRLITVEKRFSTIFKGLKADMKFGSYSNAWDGKTDREGLIASLPG